MADRTTIEWTDATWNTIGGCTRVDDGCRNCYAEVMAARFNGPGQWGEGLARIVTSGGKADHRWTGKVIFRESALTQPLRWRKPRYIFVNSTADTFHESVPDEWIDRIFAVACLCPQHILQLLTKRPARARAYTTDPGLRDRIAMAIAEIADLSPEDEFAAQMRCNAMPLPNVWLGTSISDQASADERIPDLLATQAAVRFVSAEPLLGPVDLTRVGTLDSVRSAFPNLVRRLGSHMHPHVISGMQIDSLGLPHQATTYYQTPDHMGGFEVGSRYYPRLDLVIVGGESGPGARPMHPDWPLGLRDQCVAAGVSLFFKQWGEWGAGSVLMTTGEPVFRAFPNYQTWVNKAPTWVNGGTCMDAAGRICTIGADFMRARDEGTFPVTILHRIGKKAAGRLLDGRTWDQMPGVRA